MEASQSSLNEESSRPCDTVLSLQLSERFHDDSFTCRILLFEDWLPARNISYPVPACVIHVTDPNHNTSETIHLYVDGEDEDDYGFCSRIARAPEESPEDLFKMVDNAANEILCVGKERQKILDAEKMSAGLLAMKKESTRAILEHCVRLYTQSSFLFRACHRDLGDYYALDSNKLFNYRKLLQSYISSYEKPYIGTVYRGATLSDEKLQFYVTSDLTTMWYSNTFLSTSKSRQVAEMFGNTLMIISIEDNSDIQGKAVDISEVSTFPDEKEVLLTPKYLLFKVKQPEFDSNLKKHILYLTSTLTPVYNSIQKQKNEYYSATRNKGARSLGFLSRRHPLRTGTEHLQDPDNVSIVEDKES